MNALVSIVIPTYNRAPDLERALRSVVAQTYPHWEALVVDNHSTDDTDAVVEAFGDSRIRLLKIHNDGVIAASRNLGIRHASGVYVAFLDSDDWWKPRKLQESVSRLELGADIVYHDLMLATKAGRLPWFRRARARNMTSPVFNDLLRNGCALINSSVVMRRSILEQIHGFSEERDLMAVEDFDGWLRAAQITEKFERIPGALGYYWAGGGNTQSPERRLRGLDALERRYAPWLAHLNVPDSGVYWLNYVRGTDHFLIRSYGVASQYLRRIHWSQVPLPIYVKSKLVLLFIATWCRQRP